MKQRIQQFLDSRIGVWLARLIAAWCTLGIGLVLFDKEGKFWELAFAQELPLPVVLCTLLVLWLLPLPFDILWPQRRVSHWYLLVTAGALPFVLALRYGGGDTLAFAVVLIGVWLLWCRYASTQDYLHGAPLPRGVTVALSIALGVLMAGVMGLHAVVRYRCFYVPTYDGGLFVQMFHYMRTTGLPLTTCEREGLLSHFAVHISPIFYLLLPLNVVMNGSAVSLGIGQALVVASGLLPLYLLCRDKKLSEKLTLGLMLAYCFYPAVMGGTFFDIHENCFLTPLLLWLFWCGETDHRVGFAVAALLTLCVKEDAAVLVAMYALFVIVEQKKYLRGGILLFGAVAWFFTAVWLINTYGEGAMVERFDNLMYGEQSFGAMLKTLFINPGYALKTLFADEAGGAQKLNYLVQTLLGLGMLPLLSKKPSRLLLLTPILLNLLTVYVYQYRIGFQYSFGLAAFFLYAAVLNVSDMPRKTRRLSVGFAAGAAVILCVLFLLPSVRRDVVTYRQNREQLDHMEQVLTSLPEDSSVTASTMLVAHLANRDVVYEDYYHPRPTTEFLVLDIRSGLSEEQQKTRDTYLAAGYTVWQEYPNELLILHTETPLE